MSLITRHVLVEVLKVMLLTCGTLVTVIAFGAAIRPLAQNKLGPLDAFKYIGLATVPMLQFALPISAGFAATLVLHRMASDNEVQAMSTSGMSYRRILRPIVALGALLVAAMLVLVFAVEPRFWVLLRSTVTRDAARMFVATVRDGRAFEVDGLQIFADDIVEHPPPPGSGASARLQLAGVAAVQFDASRAPARVLETEFTAEHATVDVYRTPAGTYLKPVLLQATVFREADGALVTMPRADPDAVRLADQFRLTPKLMTLGQMREAIANPAGYHAVATRIDGLRGIVAEADAWRALDDGLRREGRVVFDEHVRGRRYEVRGARLDGERLVASDGLALRVAEFAEPVEAAEKRPLREATAATAAIGAVRDRHDGRIRFDLALIEPRVEGGELAGRWPLRVVGLALADNDDSAAPDATPKAGATVAEVVASVDAMAARGVDAPGPTERLASQSASWREAIDQELQRLDRQVTSQIAKRIAIAVSALLLVVLGAVLAIWRRRALPLEIYVVAFLPAIANLLLMSSGEHLVVDGRTMVGMATIWSGNGLIAAVIGFVWWRMARH